MVKTNRKTNTMTAQAIPKALLRAPVLSSLVRMNAATRKSEMPCVTNETVKLFTRPRRSITRAAAAVPMMPVVLTRPESQADFSASKPARLKSVPAHVAMARMPVHCWICCSQKPIHARRPRWRRPE